MLIKKNPKGGAKEENWYDVRKEKEKVLSFVFLSRETYQATWSPPALNDRKADEFTINHSGFNLSYKLSVILANSKSLSSLEQWTLAFVKTNKQTVGKKEIWKKKYLAKCCCIWWRSQSSAALETCASFSVIYCIYNSVTAHKRVGIINAFNNEELRLIPVIRSLLSLNCQANQWVCTVCVYTL